MLVIAHRGASAELPENTLPAFERAIELGADFVELDVHAPDGRSSSPTTPPRRGVTYPTLAEVLDLCRGRIGVMVELKTPYVPATPSSRARSRCCDDDDVLVCFQRARDRGVRADAARAPHRAARRLGVSIAARPRGAGRSASGTSARPGAALDDRAALGLETTVYTVNDEARMPSSPRSA